MKPNDFATGKVPVWCPGCGNFSIWNALKGGLADAGVEPHKTVLVSGIGCSGKMTNHIRSYNLHTLHGRTMPTASGIKLANHELTVVANGGDGDGYGMGMGHLIHAMRRNLDITYIIHLNRTYGLTTGQAAPTAMVGTKTKSTPFGVLEMPVNGALLALSSGATYIARGYSGDLALTRSLIAGGIRHKGFALIEILQPCVTFARDYGYEYYDPRIAVLGEEHHPENRNEAVSVIMESEKFPIGLIYREEKPTYEDGLPQLAGGGLATRKVEKRDISALVDKVR